MDNKQRKFYKEWKRKDLKDISQINEEYYQGVEPLLKEFFVPPFEKTNIPYSRAYDAKMMVREIIDNIYRHNSMATHISVDFRIIDQKKVKIVIYHIGGNDFNPFSEKSTCTIIKKIRQDIDFEPKAILTDSMKWKMLIKFDLIPEEG